jgi:hypothetical protein
MPSANSSSLTATTSLGSIEKTGCCTSNAGAAVSPFVSRQARAAHPVSATRNARHAPRRHLAATSVTASASTAPPSRPAKASAAFRTQLPCRNPPRAAGSISPKRLRGSTPQVAPWRRGRTPQPHRATVAQVPCRERPRVPTQTHPSRPGISSGCRRALSPASRSVASCRRSRIAARQPELPSSRRL